MSKPSVPIPDRMLAATIREFGSTPVVQEVAVPVAGTGQVLVRVAAAPVNPSDLGFIRGGYGSAVAAQQVPGFEGSGTVVAAGDGFLGRVLIGKRVACATNASAGGTWAEYVVVSAASCVPLPQNVSMEQGASSIVNPMTALAFFEMARRERHAAIVNSAAAGALGRMILRLGLRARIPIIHIVRAKEQVDLIRSLGGNHVLNLTDPDFEDRFRRLSADLKATLILDAIGGEFTRQMIELSPFGSTLVAYGFLSGVEAPIGARTLATQDKRVVGFFLPNWLKKQHPLQNLKLMFKVRKLVASDLSTNVQRTFPLNEIDSALEAAGVSTTSGKVLLTMKDPGKQEN